MLFIRGTIAHTPLRGEVELLPDQLLVVDPQASGRIVAVVPGEQEAACLVQHGGQAEDVLRLQEGQFLLPGFIDTHLHAPQYAYTGTGTHIPLMEWLETLTFPTESSFRDQLDLARDVYSKVIQRLLNNGTTCAQFFATVHLEPCQLFADLLEQAGMRAFVGKPCMDRQTPPGSLESTERAVADTEALIKYVRGKGLSRLEPLVMPRFIPTCSRALLRALGDLAAKHGVNVHSHIHEAYDEEEFAAALEGGGQVVDEAALFDEAGLLTARSVFAHGNLLTDAELERMAARGAAIAHCPLSNFYYAEKILPVSRLLHMGVKVGLGTDVSGGYDPTMLGAQRQAVVASWALHAQAVAAAEKPAELALRYQRQPGRDPDVLSWKDALWLATVGGAQALGIQDRVGTLEAGKEFDALLIDGRSGGAYDVFPSVTPSLLQELEKFLCLGDDRHITNVWVQGRPVKGA
ncbi:hypothetical protein ABPG75_008837 [Micractinium tetrahymenae]